MNKKIFIIKKCQQQNNLLPPEKLEESKIVFNLDDFKKQGVISVDLVE